MGSVADDAGEVRDQAEAVQEQLKRVFGDQGGEEGEEKGGEEGGEDEDEDEDEDGDVYMKPSMGPRVTTPHGPTVGQLGRDTGTPAGPGSQPAPVPRKPVPILTGPGLLRVRVLPQETRTRPFLTTSSPPPTTTTVIVTAAAAALWPHSLPPHLFHLFIAPLSHSPAPNAPPRHAQHPVCTPLSTHTLLSTRPHHPHTLAVHPPSSPTSATSPPPVVPPSLATPCCSQHTAVRTPLLAHHHSHTTACTLPLATPQHSQHPRALHEYIHGYLRVFRPRIQLPTDVPGYPLTIKISGIERQYWYLQGLPVVKKSLPVLSRVFGPRIFVSTDTNTHGYA
ncbi:hypothetical protein OF83DRAFT_1182999 [Amylostereum chailletii]|nr:hypothetical protein OF83DRAFT_1182999 [Amylostereum chailletii]